MGRSLLQCFFSHSLSFSFSQTYTHTHTHWLSLGSGVQKGYWGCGSAGCVMQCSGSHVFPGNSQGFFSLTTRAHGASERLTRNIRTYLSSSFVFQVARHGQGNFFLQLCFIRSNLCHSQISIICRSNLLLEKLCRNLSNYEKLFPLTSDNGHIHYLCSFFVSTYAGFCSVLTVV